MNDDYTNTTGVTSTIPIPREGHAIFRRGDRYYMMTSHLPGWAPNPADLFISDGDTLDGAVWTRLGNPTGSSTTFNSQSTLVISYPSTVHPGESYYIYIGDRWNPLINASYIWLPFQFHTTTNVTVTYLDQWKLTDF